MKSHWSEHTPLNFQNSAILRFGTNRRSAIKYLALNYFPKGPPPKYCRPFAVSLLSSGWNKVGQKKREH